MIAEYIAPQTLDEVARRAAEDDVALLAGGTDLLPRWTRGLAEQPATVVDLKRVAGLSGVTRHDGEVRLGACTLMADVAADPVIREAAPVLAHAASCIACPQIRNRATIGGNLCNASPAADTAIPLILLDAVLDLASYTSDGLTVRSVRITEFFLGPGRTALEPGEILTRLRFKPLPSGTFAAWDKFGTRPAMEIAVASVGVALQVDGGSVSQVRVGFGSVAPTPLRGIRAEAELVGRRWTAGETPALPEEVIARCVAAAQDEISPITDVRASAAYRREMVGVLLRRMLERACQA